MSNLAIFIRQIRSRSLEHQKAMSLLAGAGLAGQMVSVLRQELDSMTRVIYLLTQTLDRRDILIDASFNGKKWTQEGSNARVTDKEMVDLAQKMHGWTKSVYKFGCAFIHLSDLHYYNDRDPLQNLGEEERNSILNHCRFYHGGPREGADQFQDFLPYLPAILEKFSDNLDCYLEHLEENLVLNPDNI